MLPDRTVYAVFTATHKGEPVTLVYAWPSRRTGDLTRSPMAWCMCGGPRHGEAGSYRLSTVSRKGFREVAPETLHPHVRDTLDGFLAEEVAKRSTIVPVRA